MKDVTERLRKEHASIERVLDLQRKTCRAMQAGADAPLDLLEDTIEFLRRFADGRHHKKEEEVLFPALERAGLPVAGGPIGVMLHDHEVGRALVLRMIECLVALRSAEPGASRGFCEAAEAYGRLLRSHIQKENGVLFPIAERLLDDATKAQVEERFDAVDETEPVPPCERRLAVA